MRGGFTVRWGRGLLMPGEASADAAAGLFALPLRAAALLDAALDNKYCQWLSQRAMDELEVIDSPAAAVVALDPVRSRLLAELSQPGSAASLAQRVGMSRQKVNYHLGALEEHGLVRAASERRWGGITERLVIASASSYVVSPVALGPAAADPGRTSDHLAASYVIALAARVVHEVAELWRRARKLGKRLPSLSVDTEIRFRSAAERSAFTNDLSRAISALVARYHDGAHVGGRSHRLIVLCHPLPEPHAEKEPS